MVPTQHNGRSIYKPIETAYFHADSSDYGWGAVLNNDSNYQARGFWTATDRLQHITWKELRAVRHAVESFLPQLKGRQVLLHEDNTAVVAALIKLTSRSPVMITELRRLWYLLDTNVIHIRPRYIRSTANIWADSLSRELDTEDWQLNPRLFRHLQERWGPHTIDRFASMLNAQLPRSTPDGGTRSARTSTAYTCPTRPGTAKTTIATPRCPPYRRWPPSWPNLKPQRRSSPPTGRTRRGTTLSPGSPPRLYTSRRPATFSFPVGSAGERGSDLPRGASLLFGSHPLLVVHPTRSDWPCVTPGPINSCSIAGSPPPNWTTSILRTIRSSTGALGRRSG
jgi:hypothetical protein